MIKLGNSKISGIDANLPPSQGGAGIVSQVIFENGGFYYPDGWVQSWNNVVIGMLNDWSMDRPRLVHPGFLLTKGWLDRCKAQGRALLGHRLPSGRNGEQQQWDIYPIGFASVAPFNEIDLPNANWNPSNVGLNMAQHGELQDLSPVGTDIYGDPYWGIENNFSSAQTGLPLARYTFVSKITMPQAGALLPNPSQGMLLYRFRANATSSIVRTTPHEPFDDSDIPGSVIYPQSSGSVVFERRNYEGTIREGYKYSLGFGFNRDNLEYLRTADSQYYRFLFSFHFTRL